MIPDFRNRTPTFGTTGTFGAKPIREHRERKEKLEVAAEEARGLLAERRQFLDSADTIAAFAAEIALNGRVLNSVRHGGAGGTRTPDFRLAKAALSQLSYGPMVGDGGLEPPTSVLSGPRSNQLS